MSEMQQRLAHHKYAAAAGITPKNMGSGALMGQLLETVGRHKFWREWIEGHNKLMRMYLNESMTYPESYFCQCFRMSIDLFKHISKEVTKYDQVFEQWRNASGELGHNTYQKVTAALCILAYGIPADLVDDHLAMGESTTIMCVKRFTIAIVQVFCSTYLRAPMLKTRLDFWR
jgi:hypothetical protein